MIKNINKRNNQMENKSIDIIPIKKENKIKKEEQVVLKKDKKNNNKNNNNIEDMNKINLTKADNIVNSINTEKSNVKRIKNENGLIERIESDKVVLTEDNKMLLKD